MRRAAPDVTTLPEWRTQASLADTPSRRAGILASFAIDGLLPTPALCVFVGLALCALGEPYCPWTGEMSGSAFLTACPRRCSSLDASPMSRGYACVTGLAPGALMLEPRIAADPDRRLLVIVRLQVIAGGADSMRPAEQVDVVRPAKDGSVRLGEVA